MNNKFCEYIRVSTQRQGRSGLGLQAQQEINRRYTESVGGEIIATYKDVESGTHRDRPGLWKAINFCKENDCTLLVAKLDRLARDVEFTFKVINTGIDIHFVDMPTVNTMILGVFASVAQYERELTSKRTKDALAAKRSKGFKLGNAKGCSMEKAQAASATARREKAKSDPNNRIIWGVVCDCATASDFERAGRKLSHMGVRTSSGLEFTTQRARSAYHNLKRIYNYEKDKEKHQRGGESLSA